MSDWLPKFSTPFSFSFYSVISFRFAQLKFYSVWISWLPVPYPSATMEKIDPDSPLAIAAQEFLESRKHSHNLMIILNALDVSFIESISTCIFILSSMLLFVG